MPLRRCGSIPVAAILLVLILLLASCARTDISSKKTDADRGPLPRPDQIIVYNFAVSPDEVKLERGLVDARTESGTRGRLGRPRKYYALTTAGADALLKAYTDTQRLAEGLLPKLADIAGR